MITFKKAMPFFTFATMVFFMQQPSQAMKSCDSGETWVTFDIKPYVQTISKNIEGLTFSSDGKFFSATECKPVPQYNIDFASMETTKLYVWDINYKEPKITIDTKLFYDDHFFSPEGSFLGACGPDDFLYIYSLPSLTLIHSLDKKTKNAYFLNEKLLFVSFDDDDSTSTLFYIDKQVFTEIKTFKNVGQIQISNQSAYQGSNQDFKVGVLFEDEILEFFDMQADYSLKKNSFIL